MITKQRRHPDWLKVSLPAGTAYQQVAGLLQKHHLHTVCSEAKCPNKGECFNSGTATFLIMGAICTRNCGYCNIGHGVPLPLDGAEPDSVAQSVLTLKLSYAVVTSVTRDDLEDFGAEHFYQTIRAIQALNPNTKVEVLVPDFQGNRASIQTVLSANPYVFNHNLEVAKVLFKRVRPQGNYDLSLEVLSLAKELDPNILTKSGLMVGLGESVDEIYQALCDLRQVKVDIVTLGQYLQPRKELLPVEKYYTPDEFIALQTYAENLGFSSVFSGPLVRSSYHAGDIL